MKGKQLLRRIQRMQSSAKALRKMGFVGVTLGVGMLGFDVATILFMPKLMSVAFLGLFTSALVISMSLLHMTVARGIIERKDWVIKMSEKEMPKWFRWFNPRWLIIIYVVTNVPVITWVILKILM